MKDHINGYSLALFSLAKEEKKFDEYKKCSQELLMSFKENEDYIELLVNRFVETEIKIKMLTDAFENKIKIIHNIFTFLLILAERNKFRLVIPVLEKLIQFINNEIDVHEGVIYTTKKLDNEQVAKIEKKVEKILNYKVTLRSKIDKKLISGIQIHVGDMVIEDSINSRLEDIKNQLLRKDN